MIGLVTLVTLDVKMGLFIIENSSKFDIVVFELPKKPKRKVFDLFLVKAGQSLTLDHDIAIDYNKIGFRFIFPEMAFV